MMVSKKSPAVPLEGGLHCNFVVAAPMGLPSAAFAGIVLFDRRAYYEAIAVGTFYELSNG